MSRQKGLLAASSTQSLPQYEIATNDMSMISERRLAPSALDLERQHEERMPGALALGHSSHSVFNQGCPFTGYNAYRCDRALLEGVKVHGGEWGNSDLEQLGMKVGSALWQARATDANRHVPRLETHDRFGNRRDAAEYHPTYHQLMELGLKSGAASFAWKEENRGRPGAHVIRGTLLYLMTQLDPGVCCPITMTFASVPALERQKPEHDRTRYVAELLSKLRVASYSGDDTRMASKVGITLGMSMTEKQGGSDVRANTTQATPLVPEAAGAGDAFVLVGHKWFTSAPMSDAFLTLAQTKEGLSCFVVPRWLQDGSRNSGFTVQRLKEKLGDKSNASSEVEYHRAWGLMLGEPGRGVRTIVEMVAHTRLDCTISSASLMRLSAQHAARHAYCRSAFGQKLIDQPLMRGVLADLALESEAALATWLRLARALDHAPTDTFEASFFRIAIAVSKYYICKRAPQIVYEAMECHGGNGFAEEGPMPRLFRQSPLNAIWEGSGNVICLDVIRALVREPTSATALLGELDKAVPMATNASVKNSYGQIVAFLRKQLTLPPSALEPKSRAIVDKLAVCLQASVLLRYGDHLVSEAFLATRMPVFDEERDTTRLLTHNLGALACDLPEATIQRLLDRLLVVEGLPEDVVGVPASSL